MIICLGPICFPIWQLFPVLVLLLAKAKAVYYWMIGKPMPVEDGDKKKVDGPNEAKVADAGGSGASAETLRQRRAGGVTSVKSVEDWHSLVKVCVPFRSALTPSLKNRRPNLGAGGRRTWGCEACSPACTFQGGDHLAWGAASLLCSMSKQGLGPVHARRRLLSFLGEFALGASLSFSPSPAHVQGSRDVMHGDAMVQDVICWTMK